MSLVMLPASRSRQKLDCVQITRSKKRANESLDESERGSRSRRSKRQKGISASLEQTDDGIVDSSSEPETGTGIDRPRQLQNHRNQGYTSRPSKKVRPAFKDPAIKGTSCHVTFHVPPEGESFPFQATSKCDLLSLFQMEYTVYGLTCHACGTLVKSLDCLPRHLKKDNHCSTGRINPAEFKDFMSHLASSFRIPPTAHFPIPNVVDHPIPGLSPYLAVGCHVLDCLAWNKAGSGSANSRARHALRHIAQKHPGLPPPSPNALPCRYVMRPYRIDRNDPDFNKFILLPQGWTPPALIPSTLTLASPVMPSTAVRSIIDARRGVTAPAPPRAIFLDKLHWTELVQGLGEPEAGFRLICSVPSFQQYNKLLVIASPCRPLWRLLVALRTISTLLQGYLIDGNRFAYSHGSEVRDVLTAGTHAKFRDLKLPTLRVYSKSLFRFISLLLWCALLDTHDDDEQLASLENQDLGAAAQAARRLVAGHNNLNGDQNTSIWSLLTPDQESALEDLVEYIWNKNSTTLLPLKLLQLTHRLLIAVIKHELKTGESFQSPIDYSLCFGSLLPDHRFHSANHITRQCAALQHSFFIALLHDARLRSANLDGTDNFSVFKDENWTHEMMKPVNLSSTNGDQEEAEAEAENSEDGADGSESGGEDEEEWCGIAAEDFNADREAADADSDADIDAEADDIPGDAEDIAGQTTRLGDVAAALIQSRDESSLASESSSQQAQGSNGVSSLTIGGSRSQQGRKALFSTFRSARAARLEGHQDNSNDLIKYISENAAWVRPKISAADTFSTPHMHIKSVWWKARVVSYEEHPDSGFAFSPDGQSLLISTPSHQQELPFQLLACTAQDAVTGCQNAILDALPAQSDNLFHDFPYATLTDHLTHPRSLLLQPNNQTILTPYITELTDVLSRKFTRPGQEEFHDATVKKWLKHDHRILAALSSAIMLTSGVPMRDFQLSSLRYDEDSDTGSRRNVYILHHAVALVNPKAKQLDKEEEECIWILVPLLSKALLFYLGVLRPITTAFMDAIKLPTSPDYHIHIFTRVFLQGKRVEGTSPACWNGSVVNAALLQCTLSFPVILTSRLLRSLFTHILRTFVPQFFLPSRDKKSSGQDAVDLQGQHQRSTSLIHYGRSLNVPPIPGISPENVTRCIACSRTLQFVLGLAKPDAEIADFLSEKGSTFVASKKNEALALSNARSSICIYYGLGGRNSMQENRLQVKLVLEQAPYIYGTEALDPTFVSTLTPAEIGDQVLISVMKSLKFGSGVRPLLQVPLPGGCSTYDGSTAVAIIVTALEEWRSGRHAALDQVDLINLRHFRQVKNTAQHVLERLQQEQPSHWLTFSSRVDSLPNAQQDTCMEDDSPIRGVPLPPHVE